MNTHSCDWCKTPFEKKKKVHRFCSTRCRVKSHRNDNGQPLVPKFKKKAKGIIRGAFKRKLHTTPQSEISPTLPPRIAEIQTKINWLESQKVSEVSTSGLAYGGGAALASRLVTKDWRLTLGIGVLGFFYGKSQDEHKAQNAQLQNANIQRQIDELKTEIAKEKTRELNRPAPPVTVQEDYKLISADRVGELEHQKYDLEDKWRYFLNYLPTSFNGIIYGLPKAGKTHLALQFAQYLQKKFGGVMYVSGEEGVEEPFNDKLKRYNSNFQVAYDVKGSFGIMKLIERTKPKFVFIDSLNRLGLNVNDIISFKENFPNTVFIYIMQSTKDGNFKGGQDIAHEVTSMINVVGGVAHQKGRTVPEPTQLNVFSK